MYYKDNFCHEVEGVEMSRLPWFPQPSLGLEVQLPFLVCKNSFTAEAYASRWGNMAWYLMGKQKQPMSSTTPYQFTRIFFKKNKQYAFIYFLLIISTQLPFTKGRLKENAELSESFVSTLNLDQTLVQILIV